MSLRLRFYLNFLIVLVGFALLFILLIFELRESRSELDEVVGTHEQLEIVMTAEKLMNQKLRLMTLFLLSDKQEQSSELADLSRRIDSYFDDWHDSITRQVAQMAADGEEESEVQEEAEELESIATLRENYRNIELMYKNALVSIDADDSLQRAALLRRIEIQYVESLFPPLNKAIATEQDEVTQSKQELRESLQRIFIGALFGALIVAGIVLCIQLLLTRVIASAVKELVRAAKAYGRQDFSYRLPSLSGEFGLVGDALVGMVKEIRLRTVDRDSLRLVMDAIPDLILYCDNEGQIVELNSAVDRLLGYRHQSFIGRQANSLFRREDTHEPIILSFSQVENNLQAEMQHRNGEWIPVHLSCTPLTGASGSSVEGAVLMARDMREINRLQDYQRWIAQILDESFNEVYVFDADTLRFTQVSRGAQKNLGYTMEELEVMTPPDLEPEYTAERFNELIEPLRAAREPRDRPIIFETVHRRKDGSTYPVEVRLQFSPSAPSDSPDRFIAIVLDITERRKSEAREQLRMRILESVNSGDAIESSLEMIANAVEAEEPTAFCSILVADETGKYLETASAPSLPSFYSKAVNGLEIGDGVASCGTAAFTKERVVVEDVASHPYWGDYRELAEKVGIQACCSEPLLTSKGELLGTLCLCYREPLNLEEQQFEHIEWAAGFATLALQAGKAQADRVAREVAEQASRTKSEFLATMSHEIRTPMNGVIGMIDVLQRSSLREDQVNMVDLIRDSAFSLLGIIDDILDFSKIEVGKVELDYQPINVADVLESACAMLDRLAVKKEVELTLFTDPRLPEQLLADQQRLRQVLVNLVNNAIKFSSQEEHEGRVAVRVLLSEQNNRRSTELVDIEFQVIDNGIGMDEATQARLFTPFTQADSSTSRRFGGTGLGLTISQNLINLMGGEIVVSSVPDQGSTFRVTVPFSVPNTESAPQTIRSDVEGLCCLVVGGTGGLSDDFAVYLEHAGASVKRVKDLAAAWQWADTGQSGLWVWVIDAGESHLSEQELRAAIDEHPDLDVHMVAVVIERGKRRQPRQVADSLITVDGNVLCRATFLQAVAAAAGRVELRSPLRSSLESSGEPVEIPSRDEALRQGRLILVAEDNTTNQKVILHQLSLLGYAADIAGDGEAALNRLRSGDYALLLSDLHMPKMDGYELSMAIRAEEQGRRIPIIALTANALSGEADRCLEVGMDGYLSKPARLEELKAVISKWLPDAPSALLQPHSDAQSQPSDSSMATEPCAAPPADFSVLEDMVGGDAQIAKELLQMFLDSTPAIADDIHSGFQRGQLETVADAAHKLKSSARSIGALVLGDLCESMERAGEAANTDALKELLPRFDAKLAELESYLVTELKNRS